MRKVGDTVRLSAVPRQNFTVRGIVATKEEGGYENIFGAIFGYYYLDLKADGRCFDEALTPGADDDLSSS